MVSAFCHSFGSLWCVPEVFECTPTKDPDFRSCSKPVPVFLCPRLLPLFAPCPQYASISIFSGRSSSRSISPPKDHTFQFVALHSTPFEYFEPLSLIRPYVPVTAPVSHKSSYSLLAPYDFCTFSRFWFPVYPPSFDFDAGHSAFSHFLLFPLSDPFTCTQVPPPSLWYPQHQWSSLSALTPHGYFPASLPNRPTLFPT